MWQIPKSPKYSTLTFAKLYFCSGFRQNLMDWMDLALAQPQVLSSQVRGQNMDSWLLQECALKFT